MFSGRPLRSKMSSDDYLKKHALEDIDHKAATAKTREFTTISNAFFTRHRN